MEDKEKSAEDLVAEMMNQPDAPTETNTETAAPAEQPVAETAAPAEAPAPTAEAAPAEQPVAAPVAEAPVEAPAPAEQPAPMPVESPAPEPVAEPAAPQPMPQPMPEPMPAARPVVEQPMMAQPAVEQPAMQPMAEPVQPMAGQPMTAPAQPATQPDVFPDLSDINLNQPSSTQIKAPSKRPIILALIAAMIVIVGIVVVAIVMMSGSKNSNNTNNGGSNTPPVVVPDDEEGNEEMTEEEKAALKAEQVAAVTEVVDQLKETVVGVNPDYKITDTTEEEMTVMYKVDGAKAAVALDEAIGFSAALEGDDIINTIEGTKDALEESLNNLGFEKTTGYGSGNTFYDKDKNVICGPIRINTTSLDISCASTAWYSEDDVAFANELVDAYDKNGDSKAIGIVVRKALIKDSEVSPYQSVSTSLVYETAEGENAGGIAKFYRINPTSAWTFFTATSMVLPCSDYNTDDLKAAFHGETCYNEVDGQQVEAKVE